MDAIFAIERQTNGATAAQRLAVRQERVKPLVGELERWMVTERARLSRHADIAKAMDSCSSAGPPSCAFSMTVVSEQRRRARFAGIALGRRAWLFAGSDRGEERAAGCTP